MTIYTQGEVKPDGATNRYSVTAAKPVQVAKVVPATLRPGTSGYVGDERDTSRDALRANAEERVRADVYRRLRTRDR